MSETRGYLAREGGERLAWRKVAGEGPTVVWLSGYRSDMTGTKAEAIAEWAQTCGRGYIRFDYFGTKTFNVGYNKAGEVIHLGFWPGKVRWSWRFNRAASSTWT